MFDLRTIRWKNRHRRSAKHAAPSSRQRARRRAHQRSYRVLTGRELRKLQAEIERYRRLLQGRRARVQKLKGRVAVLQRLLGRWRTRFYRLRRRKGGSE